MYIYIYTHTHRQDPLAPRCLGSAATSDLRVAARRERIRGIRVQGGRPRAVSHAVSCPVSYSPAGRERATVAGLQTLFQWAAMSRLHLGSLGEALSVPAVADLWSQRCSNVWV